MRKSVRVTIKMRFNMLDEYDLRYMCKLDFYFLMRLEAEYPNPPPVLFSWLRNLENDNLFSCPLLKSGYDKNDIRVYYMKEVYFSNLASDLYEYFDKCLLEEEKIWMNKYKNAIRAILKYYWGYTNGNEKDKK